MTLRQQNSLNSQFLAKQPEIDTNFTLYVLSNHHTEAPGNYLKTKN
jgi:hypothetical protein